jgi:hypothetical protein
MYSRAQTDLFWQKAEEIFSFLLDHFKANPNPVSDAQLIQGSTTLTYAIVNAHPCAVGLIQEDMGVFDLDGAKRSPLFWADRQHDKRLESQLKARYKAKVSKIVAFLLNADSRVVDKSSGALVLSMVSGWVDLKEDIFTELSELIENKETPLRRLGNIQAQIETPHSALSQFFNLGHGEHFWQAASPWPSRFAPLLEFIKDKIASNNSSMALSSSGRFLWQ